MRLWFRKRNQISWEFNLAGKNFLFANLVRNTFLSKNGRKLHRFKIRVSNVPAKTEYAPLDSAVTKKIHRKAISLNYRWFFFQFQKRYVNIIYSIEMKLQDEEEKHYSSYARVTFQKFQQNIESKFSVD